MSQPWWTCAEFAPCVGDTFEVGAGEGGATLALELAEAAEGSEPGGPGPDGQERLQFSLLFHGPADRVLAQGSYQLHHDRLGDLELFLVPLGPQAGAMRYEAAFA